MGAHPWASGRPLLSSEQPPLPNNRGRKSVRGPRNLGRSRCDPRWYQEGGPSSAPSNEPRDRPRSRTAMKLSPEERSAINRRNASLSTGPKSDRGRRAVSMNACKHGMCARKVALPHEDPEAVATQLERWTESCQPADDMELYLVE